MDEKIEFEKAPKEGLLLAYFRDGIVFRMYHLEDILKDKEVLFGHDCKELLELHMFDEKNEFRAVRSRRCRKFLPNNLIEVENEDYIEEMVLLNEDKPSNIDTIKIRSYLEYNEYGMVSVSGFQLLMDKGDCNE